MKLTANDLEKANACHSQIDLFREHFGDGGTVTLAKVRKVAALFDWDWAAEHLLSPKSWAEYRRALASALAEYNRATASAWAEYDRARAPALAKHDRARAAAQAEYDRATAPALAEYQRAKAPAWFAGWKADHARKA